jgi:hypothetical protein
MPNVVSRSYRKRAPYAHTMRRRAETLTILEKEQYVKELLSDSRYEHSKRLEHYGLSLF